MAENDEKHDSPVLDPLANGDNKEIYELFKNLLGIYNSGAFDPLIDFVKSDGRILLYLMNCGGQCHPSDLSDGLNLSRPNVAANLRNMEKIGYITRETDKTNRRQVFVKITPAGIGCYNEQTTQIVQMVTLWLTMIGEEESKHLIEILNKTSSMAKVLEQMNKKNKKKEKDDNIWNLF